jgi:[ribosomal protein S18]-alanine N-acetyltransferase
MPVGQAGRTPALPVRIRRATAADVHAVMALEKLAVAAAHWTTEQYRCAFSGEGPSRVALVVEEETGVRGFIVGRALGDEWEIENVAVAESVRRRGLGARLLEEFLDRARDQGAKSVFLDVRESNLAARSLYEKRAFVEVSRRKRYYRDPEEDAIVYRLNLN